MNTTLKTKLNSTNEVAIGTWLTMAHPAIAEIMCNADFDWVCLDMEHSSISIADVERLIRVIDLKGKAALVRLTNNDPNLAKRVMDVGAHGIIVPMVNSKKEAELAVKSIKYPPLGIRGVGLARAQSYGASFSEYHKWNQKHSTVIVQIEHIDAVNNLDEIFSVEGIDGYIIGPYDLSASMGIPGEFDNPKLIEAIKLVGEKAKEYGVPGGIHVVEPDVAAVKEKINEGFRFIAYSVDMRVLDTGFRYAMKELR